MRPIAIITAVVLLGVFTSTTASQTQSLPPAPEPPRRLSASDLANAPNVLRQGQAVRKNTAHGNTARENVPPPSSPYRKVESRQPESWLHPPATADKPASLEIVAALPPAHPPAAAVVLVEEQMLSALRQHTETAPPAVMPANYDATPKERPKNSFSVPDSKTDGRRETRPGNPAEDLSDGFKKLPLPRKSRTADMKLGESRKDQKQDKSYETPGGLSSLITIGGSLALVIGLFLIVAFFMRRATPTANLTLPDEVVEVLGRAPLANRQQVHLMRCGNKLLLVCVTPNGTETLTEITDPAEVDRLAALCRSSGNGSATSNFRQVLEQLSWESESSKPTGGRS